MTFWLDILPEPKLRPRLGRHGAYTPDKTRRYEKALRIRLQSLYLGDPLKSALKVEIRFFMGCPARRPSKSAKNYVHPCTRPDVDNLQKAVFDAANGVLWVDDGQIVDARAIKIYDWATREVGIEISVEEL